MEEREKILEGGNERKIRCFHEKMAVSVMRDKKQQEICWKRSLFQPHGPGAGDKSRHSLLPSRASRHHRALAGCHLASIPRKACWELRNGREHRWNVVFALST
ncbi:hypothetical protein B566_EDAN006273 [Ephemera danica]|nr:hypothetical protein B566_EDAN006273 [Ephemera danica]